jgi:uncharacterized membrane protein
METQGPETRLNYSRNDTNIAKGIAVILLLNHHLFFLVKDAPPLINGFSFVYFFANVSKVCVAIFVFLSGYGLSKSWKDESLLLFLKKRLIKFFFKLLDYMAVICAGKYSFLREDIRCCLPRPYIG